MIDGTGYSCAYRMEDLELCPLFLVALFHIRHQISHIELLRDRYFCLCALWHDIGKYVVKTIEAFYPDAVSSLILHIGSFQLPEHH